MAENCPHCGCNPHMSHYGKSFAAYTDKQILAAVRYHRLRLLGENAIGTKRQVLLKAAFYQGCAIARSCDKMLLSSDRLLAMVENAVSSTEDSLKEDSLKDIE